MNRREPDRPLIKWTLPDGIVGSIHFVSHSTVSCHHLPSIIVEASLGVGSPPPIPLTVLGKSPWIDTSDCLFREMSSFSQLLLAQIFSKIRVRCPWSVTKCMFLVLPRPGAFVIKLSVIKLPVEIVTLSPVSTAVLPCKQFLIESLSGDSSHYPYSFGYFPLSYFQKKLPIFFTQSSNWCNPLLSHDDCGMTKSICFGRHPKKG